MPSTYPQETNQSARFSSTLQTSTNQLICFKFWYFFYGKKMGRLNVYLDQFPVADNSNNFNRTLIWTKSTTQGRRWFESRRTITSKYPWKLTIEGTIGKTYSSDIGLDDLDSYIGQCTPTKLCDFEIDLCEYKNTIDGSADINWIRGLPSNYTDHTSNSAAGSVAYVDLKNGNVNSKARLVSANFLPNGAECLQFWYLNTGLNSSKLNVYEKKQTSYGQALWSRVSHENQEDWRFGYLFSFIFIIYFKFC
jgi:hypothetical protein